MPTARSEELQALAERVADALPPEVIEVVLTGSVSRGVADDVSDLDAVRLAPSGPNVDRARAWLGDAIEALE